MFDGSPLGKLEIFGPDAAQFLDLMYVGTMSNLSLGQARYGLLLNENGIVVDDGIVARLGQQHTGSTPPARGAERTAAAFEEWLQCEYTDLRVLVTPVTSRWANVTVAGPRAWDWLAGGGVRSGAWRRRSMEHMTRARQRCCRRCRCGCCARASAANWATRSMCLRITPAAVLERLWERAADLIPRSYTASKRCKSCAPRRATSISAPTPTAPRCRGDIGFARALDRKAANFVGRRSLLRPAARDPNRLQLVALSPLDRRTLLPVGAQIAPGAPPTQTEGHVTSSYWSPELGRPVALGLLARGTDRLGDKIRIHHLGTVIEAEVVKAPFIDASGERLRG